MCFKLIKINRKDFLMYCPVLISEDLQSFFTYSLCQYKIPVFDTHCNLSPVHIATKIRKLKTIADFIPVFMNIFICTFIHL